MKVLITILFCCLFLNAAEFENAFKLTEEYKKYGFLIKGPIKIEMFRRLSSLYDEIEDYFDLGDKKIKPHTAISFIDPIQKTKMYVASNVINLAIPEIANAKIEFNQYRRIKFIYDFLMENSIQSSFYERNFLAFEKFITIYNGDKFFKGISIAEVKFENVLYPKPVMKAGSRFEVVLPIGNSNLYWQKVVSILNDTKFDGSNLNKLADDISKKSPIEASHIDKVLVSNRQLFLKDKSRPGSIEEAKFRERLIRLLAREFPSSVNDKELVKALENIPYWPERRKKVKEDIIKDFKELGGLSLKAIRVIYLTPVRVKTLYKIIKMLEVNKDLQNVNVYAIEFKSRKTKPVAIYDKKDKSYILQLSDFSTKNNIFEALKTVPLK